jgi:hypothetical protein
MGQGDPGSNGDGEFKHGKRPVGIGRFEQKVYCNLSDLDDFTFHKSFVTL